MTPEQEKSYLLDLLFEAARYRDVSMDSPYSAIELEIRDRIHRLTSTEDDTDAHWKSMLKQEAKPEIHVESETLESDDYKALEAAYLQEHLERAIEKKRKQSVEAKSRWKEERVRVQENGRPVWYLRSECIKVPRDNSKGGMPWKWAHVGPGAATQDADKEKQEQIDKMWESHESQE